ncbi:SdrD B-like domain-containing protein [Roseburia hominis]
MQGERKQEAAGYLARNRRRRTRKKIIGALACIVVLGTVYTLILPALTLEKTQKCEKTEHTHSEACYVQAANESENVPVCTPKTLDLHEHTKDCLDKNGEYCCGYSDFVVHEHNSACFDSDGKLWCSLTEVKAHTHDQSCYTQVEAKPSHTHTDECYTTERGELACAIPEGEGAHAHSEDLGCYDEDDSLICQKEETSGHQHTDDCYAWNKVLTCKLSTEPAKSAEPELICDKEEIILHEHSPKCFDENDNLICGKTQVLEHKHTEACFRTAKESVLSCNLEEHTHSAACSVIELIEALPTRQSVEERIAAFEEDGDEAGGDAYLAELKTQIEKAYEAYDALTEEEQAKVTNVDRLTALEWLRDFAWQQEAVDASPAAPEETEVPTDEAQDNGTQDNGDLVAYDAENENDARVKATVTLPEGQSAPEGYKLSIREMEAGEDGYPDEKAVQAKAGEVNGWQCYTICWIKQDGTDSETMPLSESGNVKVKIEYLKEDARLPGLAGERKLLVFNIEDGSLTELGADSVEDMKVENKGYTSFTFKTSQAGPYVFVSKKLAKGYVDALNIKKIIDGSAPFDKTDNPGNDSGDSNKVVRSYDTIQYNLEATFGARQEGITETEVNVYFELTLEKSATAARFDVSKMLWLGQNYSIEYLDNSGNVIMIMDRDGKYYLPQTDGSGNVCRDEHGFASADTKNPVSMNAQVNGSTDGENSYRVTSGGVVKQRLVGWTKLKANPGESILSGTQGFSTAVEVRNADNGEIFAPTFKMWVEGNADNYGSEGKGVGQISPVRPDEDNVIKASDVKVSAGTNFNVQVKKNNDMSYKDWFDFSTGQAVTGNVRDELVRLASLEENHGKSNPAEFTRNGEKLSEELQKQYANYRYGRLTCYGITLQLYNDTDNEPEKNREAKGLRGLSLPVGDITFDLNFSSETKSDVKGQKIDPDEYTAILWDYNENIPANTAYTYNYADPGRGTVTTLKDGKGNGGRNIYWDGETRSPYAKGGGPSNYIAYHDGCYYGGDWSMVNGEGVKVDSLEKLNEIANPTVVTGTGADTTYHFSIRDYDFDFDKQHFPTRDAGNSGNIEGYDTYARCFSAGCVQVLSVFPMVQEVSEVEVFLNTTVSNLHLNTRAGQELKALDDDTTKINHEVYSKDNTLSDQIVLYKPGSLTKGSAFNGKYKENDPKTTSEGFLGTEYWTTSYDCSTFAGDEIWITSYGMVSSGGDYRTRSMNLLQLFDSRALSIRGKPGVYQNWDEKYDKPGTAKFLYAADPEYPGGYDTNREGVLAYMNSVREEDLCYYTSLEALKSAGYTCVGVLMELRGCDLLGGKYQYMRIPVTVNGNDKELVSKTVATVNTFRVWSYDLDAISWKNGEWNSSTGKNELEGFPEPTNTVKDDQYSGELANSNKNSPPYYVKTEYKDGLQVKGTHAGGTLAGNSLLILSYKAGINIGVDNKDTVGMSSYNLGDGETVVDYRLKNIRTEISDLTGQSKSPTTTLTIKTVLDEGYTGDAQRIFVSGGSYRIMGYAVDADGKVASEETSIAIGTDPNNPTKLEFVASDGKRYPIEIYARTEKNNQSVTFEIKGAPVGLHLPDITFQANFAAVTVLKNNDTIKASAYISGAGDNRAYDSAKGNTDNVTVGIVMRSGTNLTKAVSTRYIELDDEITYDVTYTNSGSDKIDKIYFYDMIPRNDDIRGSKFDGDVVLREVKVTSSEEEGASPADATVYYSTADYRVLYDKVKVFGGSADANGKISGMNESNVENMLNEEKLFQPLGKVTDGKFEYDKAFKAMLDGTKDKELSEITGLYAKVENLKKGQTIKMQITVKTKGNKADDWYKNVANCWIVGSATLPLTSNKVETQVISRSISGVVWYDRNLDGIRDDDEELLEGVTATLFKKVKNDQYELCKEDVTGGEISTVTTDKTGAYSFEKLEAGDYVVAFKGEPLKEFTDVTTYQQNGQNDANTNDGKAIAKNEADTFDPNEYACYIQYSKESIDMKLHSIDEMGTVSLVNGVEMYTNQDLGVIIATYELPMTGGIGTIPYTVGGLLIICAGLLLFWINRKYNFSKS